VTSRPLIFVDHLRLDLVRTSDDDLSDGFELCLMDSEGGVVMAFNLPPVITQAIAAHQLDWQIAMSPGGLLQVYNNDGPPQQQVIVGLDEVIRDGLSLEMLADETTLREQLATLRQRLTDSLALVDQTLADLGKAET
jgi:hypothetical protein